MRAVKFSQFSSFHFLYNLLLIACSPRPLCLVHGQRFSGLLLTLSFSFSRSALSSENFYKQLEGFTGETVIVPTDNMGYIYLNRRTFWTSYVLLPQVLQTRDALLEDDTNSDSFFFSVRFVKHERFE